MSARCLIGEYRGRRESLNFLSLICLSAGDDDVDDACSGDAVLLVGIQEREILDPFSSAFIFLAFAFIKNFPSQNLERVMLLLGIYHCISIHGSGCLR